MGAMSQSDLLQEAVIPSPFGSVLIRFDQTGQLARIDLRSISASSYCSSRAKNLANSIEAYLMQASLLQVDVTAILEKLDDGTAFQRRVWQAIAQIPSGSVMSYQALAHKVGSGARAVANACGANPLPILIPCHRVVAARGWGGFMQGSPEGLAIKRWLLQHEGVSDGYRLAS